MLGRKKSKILIIKTDGLAAFVAAEPAFDAIRSIHQDAEISLLTSANLQRIARAAPYFDQVAGMPDFRNSVERKAFVKQLKASKFERVYDLAADEDGRKLFSAMGPFRPKWHAASPPPKQDRKKLMAPVLPGLNKVLSEAGIDEPARLPDFKWALDARKDSANMKPSWYGISGPFGLLLPSANPRRRWTAHGYAGVASTMAAAGYMPVLAGHRELHAFGDEIAHETPQLVDLTGKTDHLQLVALAQEAAFFVSDDAEEVHLAVSVGCMGVLIGDPKAPPAKPEGRHVVVLMADGDLGTVAPDFVWRTLANMGLIDDTPQPRHAALTR